MKNSLRNLAILIPTIALAAAAIALRCAACQIELDYSTGLFNGNLLISISNYTVVGLVVLFISSIFIKRGVSHLCPSFRGPLSYLPSGALAASLVFISAELFSYAHRGAAKAGGLFSHPSFAVALIAGVLALCGVVYCVLSIFISANRSLLRADFGMLASLFFACYTAFLFFVMGSPINQPVKITDEMAFLAIAIFFLYETRVSLERERWSHYFAFGSVAALLSAYSSFPALFVYIFKGEVISVSIQQTLVAFASFIFVVCRLISAARLDEDTPSSFASAIEAQIAASHDGAAKEKTSEEESPQISIEDIEYPERQSEE